MTREQTRLMMVTQVAAAICQGLMTDSDITISDIGRDAEKIVFAARDIADEVEQQCLPYYE